MDQFAIKFTTNPPDAFGKTGSSSPPSALRFDAPLPNPANPATTLRFTLPHAGWTRLGLFNTLGQRTALLLDRHLEAGEQQFQINTSHLASGLYFAVLSFENERLTRKVIVLK